MNVKNIAATLAILGSASFALVGCKKEGTEAPAADSAKPEGSCGANKDGSCSGSKDAPVEAAPAESAGDDAPAESAGE